MRTLVDAALKDVAKHEPLDAIAKMETLMVKTKDLTENIVKFLEDSVKNPKKNLQD